MILPGAFFVAFGRERSLYEHKTKPGRGQGCRGDRDLQSPAGELRAALRSVHTFLGYDPKLEITCLDGEMKVGSLTFHTNDPSTYLRQILRDHKSPRFDYLPSFTGGLVGYFSYDYLTYREPTAKRKTEDAERFKDVDLMLFDKVIAFDNFRQKIDWKTWQIF